MAWSRERTRDLVFVAGISAALFCSYVQLCKPFCDGLPHSLPPDSPVLRDFPCHGTGLARALHVCRWAPRVLYEYTVLPPRDMWFGLSIFGWLGRLVSALVLPDPLYTHRVAPYITYGVRSFTYLYHVWLGPSHTPTPTAIFCIFRVNAFFDFCTFLTLQSTSPAAELAHGILLFSSTALLCRWYGTAAAAAAAGGGGGDGGGGLPQDPYPQLPLIRTSLALSQRALVTCANLYLLMWVRRQQRQRRGCPAAAEAGRRSRAERQRRRTPDYGAAAAGGGGSGGGADADVGAAAAAAAATKAARCGSGPPVPVLAAEPEGQKREEGERGEGGGDGWGVPEGDGDAGPARAAHACSGGPAMHWTDRLQGPAGQSAGGPRQRQRDEGKRSCGGPSKAAAAAVSGDAGGRSPGGSGRGGNGGPGYWQGAEGDGGRCGGAAGGADGQVESRAPRGAEGSRTGAGAGGGGAGAESERRPGATVAHTVQNGAEGEGAMSADSGGVGTVVGGAPWSTAAAAAAATAAAAAQEDVSRDAAPAPDAWQLAPLPPYKPFIRYTSYYMKIGGAEPDQMSPGWETRVRQVLAERNMRLTQAYVRRGCIELLLEIEMYGTAGGAGGAGDAAGCVDCSHGSALAMAPAPRPSMTVAPAAAAATPAAAAAAQTAAGGSGPEAPESGAPEAGLRAAVVAALGLPAAAARPAQGLGLHLGADSSETAAAGACGRDGGTGAWPHGPAFAPPPLRPLAPLLVSVQPRVALLVPPSRGPPPVVGPAAGSGAGGAALRLQLEVEVKTGTAAADVASGAVPELLFRMRGRYLPARVRARRVGAATAAAAAAGGSTDPRVEGPSRIGVGASRGAAAAAHAAVRHHYVAELPLDSIPGPGILQVDLRQGGGGGGGGRPCGMLPVLLLAAARGSSLEQRGRGLEREPQALRGSGIGLGRGSDLGASAAAWRGGGGGGGGGVWARNADCGGWRRGRRGHLQRPAVRRRRVPVRWVRSRDRRGAGGAPAVVPRGLCLRRRRWRRRPAAHRCLCARPDVGGDGGGGGGDSGDGPGDCTGSSSCSNRRCRNNGGSSSA